MKNVSSLLSRSLKQAIRNRICGPLEIGRPEPASPPTSRLDYGSNPTLFVFPGDIISDSILATGTWEPDLSEAIVKDAQQGGLLVEVGANLGYFSVLWAGMSVNNKVMAFEPVPRNLELFQKSIAYNDLQDRITVLPVAAGETAGLGTFELGPAQQTGWGGIVPDSTSSSTLTKVVVIPLDLALEQIPCIDVLKIDVEGADTLVLRGCRQLLSRKSIKKIYYEQNHPRMTCLGVDPGEAAAMLESLGYHTAPMTDPALNVVEWKAVPAGAH